MTGVQTCALPILDEGNQYALRKIDMSASREQSTRGLLRARRLVCGLPRSQTEQTALLEKNFPSMNLAKFADALIGFGGMAVSAQANNPNASGSKDGFQGITALGSRKHGRSFSFSSIQFASDQHSVDLIRSAYRLSRRFNIEYEIFDPDAHESVVQPFKNVVHSMATQGGAVTLHNNGASFLDHFISAAVVPTYFPLALVAYHEYQIGRAHV